MSTVRYRHIIHCNVDTHNKLKCLILLFPKILETSWKTVKMTLCIVCSRCYLNLQHTQLPFTFSASGAAHCLSVEADVAWVCPLKAKLKASRGISALDLHLSSYCSTISPQYADAEMGLVLEIAGAGLGPLWAQSIKGTRCSNSVPAYSWPPLSQRETCIYIWSLRNLQRCCREDGIWLHEVLGC